MTVAQEEFTKKIYEIIKDKVFFSNISEEMVEVVEELPKEIVPGKVLFDGMMLFDGIECIEDDIQQMTSYTKDGCIVNLEDYYTDSGAFDDDGWDRFIAALGRLMTVDEFSQYLDKNGNGLDFPYPIDENGHAEIPVGTLYIKNEAFMNCSKLVSVTIPDTVLEIRDHAFCGCKNLASIELPAYVRLIAPSAFNGCTSLASVVFSTVGALLIEEQAFAGCTSLTNVEFKTPPDVIVSHAFEGCPCEEEVMRKKYHYQKSPKYDIDEDESLYPIDENGHAVIPEGTIIIDDYAFLQCSKLVSVSMPNTVEEIGEGAFGSCKNLESITLPSSLGFIDGAAFFGCKGLKSVVIPNGVKMIDARAFAECTSLSEVHLPAGVAIDSSAFDGSPSYMYFEFGTVRQMTKAVAEAISNGSLLHFSSEPDNTTQIYHTKRFKEKIVLRYRKNKIFYTISAHNTIYESWTIHEEKVLKNFIKLYESTK